MRGTDFCIVVGLGFLVTVLVLSYVSWYLTRPSFEGRIAELESKGYDLRTCPKKWDEVVKEVAENNPEESFLFQEVDWQEFTEALEWTRTERNEHVIVWVCRDSEILWFVSPWDFIDMYYCYRVASEWET